MNQSTPPAPGSFEGTVEQKLAAIIEAQVKAGYSNHSWTKGARLAGSELVKEHGWDNYTPWHGHVLQILLDRDGLKAAYGESIVETLDYMGRHLEMVHRYRAVGYKVLDAWLSSGVEAAINTAFSLLPHHDS